MSELRCNALHETVASSRESTSEKLLLEIRCQRLIATAGPSCFDFLFTDSIVTMKIKWDLPIAQGCQQRALAPDRTLGRNLLLGIITEKTAMLYAHSGSLEESAFILVAATWAFVTAPLLL